MLAQTQENLLAAGIAAKLGVLLADAGYRSEENLLCKGPELLIATVKDAKQHRAAREAKPPRGRIPKASPHPSSWSASSPPTEAGGSTANAAARSSPSSANTVNEGWTTSHEEALRLVGRSGHSRTPATTS